MRLWGFYRKNGVPKLPDADGIAAASAVVGLDKVVFNDAERSVYFTVPGMSIDLGGIAKGYAADLAAERAEKNGAGSGAVNLGGNIGCLTPHADGCRGNPRPAQPHRRVRDFTWHRGASSTAGLRAYVVIDGRLTTLS